MPSKKSTARKVDSFFREPANKVSIAALGLEELGGFSSKEAVGKFFESPCQTGACSEKRVVATKNSDGIPYTMAEFKAFFGEDSFAYWERAYVPLRLQLHPAFSAPPGLQLHPAFSAPPGLQLHAELCRA